MPLSLTPCKNTSGSPWSQFSHKHSVCSHVICKCDSSVLQGLPRTKWEQDKKSYGKLARGRRDSLDQGRYKKIFSVYLDSIQCTFLSRKWSGVDADMVSAAHCCVGNKHKEKLQNSHYVLRGSQPDMNMVMLVYIPPCSLGNTDSQANSYGRSKSLR